MKKSIKTFSLIASAALLTITSLSAVSTDPVGYVTTTIPANSDGLLSTALHRPAIFSGSVASIPDSDTIEVSNSPEFLADEYAGGGNFILFTSGDREGLWAVIDSNDADSIDLTFVIQDLGEDVEDRVEIGDTFSIIPFWTPATLLPEGETAAGTQLLMFSRSQPGINISAAFIYTLYDTYGWYAGPTDVNNEPIYPDESLIVRNVSDEPLKLVQAGNVPMSAYRTVLSSLAEGVEQDIRLTSGLPSEVAIRDLLDPGTAGAGDQILIFDQDQVGQNKSAAIIATYYETYGWYSGPTERNNYLLQPGQGFVYRKAAANNLDIVVTHSPSYQQ
ncbi:TIGR02597 family protein [Coraliomargarita algicola]|uniref:TIGR02597 family protein n=1 Tax=Coraliomargarita algicola TaxID=3092156 RepID=A0ABZ0RFI5_9BACT|nr:TIGR02597 family protein [Coraliomargarita sp. J2-16]WPJ94263.1 TIGR02597 family protein [Coraliomargarita sp. J2-16]